MRLTITLPVHNAMPFLPAAVESILAQTYSAFEFLILDDGSTDGSAHYLRSLTDPRVRLIVRENRGLGTTLNELFRESRTELVARMDADDISAPDRLQKQVQRMVESPELVMLGTEIAFLHDGRHLARHGAPTGHERIRRRLLQARPGVCHPTIVVRRSAWEAVGGYRIHGSGEDLDFCLRMCERGPVENLPEPLYFYRLHKSCVSLTRQDELTLGYRYALACASARSAGSPEPDFEEVSAEWGRRSMTARMADKIRNAGETLYRRSLMMRLEGRPLAAAVVLLGAGICRADIAVRRIAGE